MRRPCVQAFLEALHRRKQKWVPIVDPGILIDPDYAPYEEGIRDGIFLRDAAGGNYVGQASYP